MTLRIEQIANDSETILTLIGRITSPDVQQLKAEIAEARNRVTLDLEQIALVDLDAVHFLAVVEQDGIHLRNLPQYVREWILQEKPRVDELERDDSYPINQ